MHLIRSWFIGIATVTLMTLSCYGQSKFDNSEMNEYAERLKETSSFRYPLDDYFPEIPVTDTDPPKTTQKDKYHTAEDCFVPAGTPVYAIGDGIISYSGTAHGYGGLIIIDHPVENVYSLYGHLSPGGWKKGPGKVKKGELIAHIGKAEECYTMRPHIHFGLRKGQKADFPSFGDARWMAGHIFSNPKLHGWFHPSEIIGQTDSMRAWHSYIRKREYIKPGRSLHASDFKITSGRYNEKENIDLIISKEFGKKYRLADWNDILTFSKNIEEWADSIGLEAGGGKNALMISNCGYKIWLGRQYSISRFNHNKPKHVLAHDAIDNNFVCLGSWYGLNRNILAVRK